jgi:hypothetical protein
MDYQASGDAAFPYPKTNLKRELYKLEFRPIRWSMILSWTAVPEC